MSILNSVLTGSTVAYKVLILGGQRGGGAGDQTFVWGHRNDFPPSHLLCTIKSQRGGGGGHVVNCGIMPPPPEPHSYATAVPKG